MSAHRLNRPADSLPPDHAVQLLQWAKQSASDASLAFPDPEICFKFLPLSRSDVSVTERNALREAGVHLWNACCTFSRDVEEGNLRELNAKGSPFASYLLCFLTVPQLELLLTLSSKALLLRDHPSLLTRQMASPYGLSKNVSVCTPLVQYSGRH